MGLQAPAGTVLPEGPTVKVLDQFGEPMPGVRVTFQVVAGGGEVFVPSRTTDPMGLARAPWRLGRAVGSLQRLLASAGSVTAAFEAEAVEPVPGESYFGRSQYTEYLPGSLPLVLSAPHGGDLTPTEIPDRTWGTMGKDRNTRELAFQIREELMAQTGAYPHVILSHLHRTKLDPNREIVEAAQGDPESARAWWEFQTFIEEARWIVEESFGEGLYIDLHGHGHPIQRLELGYLLSSADLSLPNETLATVAFVTKSSFRALGSKPGVNFADLIRGPLSLGTLLEEEEVPTVPNQNQPDPEGHRFFSGGYNTARHGSRGGGFISGVQIECNFYGIRDTAENRQALAQALGHALVRFFPEYFEMPFASLAAREVR
jgi:hypothetical protein